MVGSPLAGWLSDKIQRRKPVLLAGALLSLCCFALIILVPKLNSLSLSVLYLLCGLGGSCMVVCFGLVREWNTVQGNATAIGFANMCVVGSGALLQPLVGRMLDNRWQGIVNEGVREYPAEAFQSAFIVLLGVLLMANLCIGLVKESYCQPQVAYPG